MTAVVLIGDLPSTGFLQASAALRVDTSGLDDCAAVIDLLAHGLRERAAVLVLCPAWRSEAALRAVRLARAALDTDRIGFLPLDLPPLALSLIADEIAWIAPHVWPGVLAAVADRLAREVVAGAWVKSVSKLEHIATGFGQHVASFLPRSGFSVLAAPAPDVHRITSSKPVQDLPMRPAAPVLALMANGDGNLAWVKDHFLPALTAASLTTVQAQPLSSKYWGTTKYVEFVAVSGHPQALDAAMAADLYRPCGWCGEPTSLPTCPFCMMEQPAADGTPGSPWHVYARTQGSPPRSKQPPQRPPAPRQQPQPQQPQPQQPSQFQQPQPQQPYPEPQQQQPQPQQPYPPQPPQPQPYQPQPYQPPAQPAPPAQQQPQPPQYQPPSWQEPAGQWPAPGTAPPSPPSEETHPDPAETEKSTRADPYPNRNNTVDFRPTRNR